MNSSLNYAASQALPVVTAENFMIEPFLVYKLQSRLPLMSQVVASIHPCIQVFASVNQASLTS
jgi:hypothetical protein